MLTHMEQKRLRNLIQDRATELEAILAPAVTAIDNADGVCFLEQEIPGHVWLIALGTTGEGIYANYFLDPSKHKTEPLMAQTVIDIEAWLPILLTIPVLWVA